MKNELPRVFEGWVTYIRHEDGDRARIADLDDGLATEGGFVRLHDYSETPIPSGQSWVDSLLMKRVRVTVEVIE